MFKVEKDRDLDNTSRQLLDLRKEAEKYEKLKDKMEDDGNYDANIYDRLEYIYKEIDKLEA